MELRKDFLWGGATAANRVFDSLIIEKMLAGPIKPVFFCQKICFIL